jgi:hypothetical protein
MKLHYNPILGQERIFWIDGFLRPAERAIILEELQFAFWLPSMVLAHYADAGVKSVRSHNRVSETTIEEWFTPELLRMTRIIRERLVRFVPGIRRRREKWQATRYVKGGKFGYHYDCGSWGNEPAGERVYTVLIYLDTPRRGGSTRFRDLDLDIKAVAGRLLVWRNLTAEGRRDVGMIHSSVPLSAGRKTVLVTWVRQKNFQRKDK